MLIIAVEKQSQVCPIFRFKSTKLKQKGAPVLLTPSQKKAKNIPLQHAKLSLQFKAFLTHCSFPICKPTSCSINRIILNRNIRLIISIITLYYTILIWHLTNKMHTKN